MNSSSNNKDKPNPMRQKIKIKQTESNESNTNKHLWVIKKVQYSFGWRKKQVIVWSIQLYNKFKL